MQRAESPDQVDRVNADDFAAGEKLGQDVERHAVVWVVKGRHENLAVGDVKVCVAGGQALATKHDGARKGQLDNGELLAAERARRFERDWRRLSQVRRR